jgi:hypothetical protein
VTEHLEIYLDNIDKFHRQCMIVDFYYRSNSNDFPMVRFMMFSATFNNISVILWRSVLFAEETGVLGENHRTVASH